MKFKGILLSAGIVATSISTANADPVTDYLNLLGDLAVSSEDFDIEKDASGAITRISGQTNGEDVTITPDMPVSETTTSVTFTTDTTGEIGTLSVSTDGTGLRDVNPGDLLTVFGEIDGVSLDVKTEAPSDDQNEISGTINGNDFKVILPEGKTLDTFDTDTDAIIVTKDGEEVFEGIASEISEVEAASLATQFEAISSNPMSALATQAAALGGFFSLVSRGTLQSDSNGFSFNTNRAPDNAASFGFTPPGAFSAETNPYSALTGGAWIHGAYKERTVSNSIGTFDTSFRTVAAGAHLVVDQDYVIGIAAGFQNSDATTVGTSALSDAKAMVVSPYAGALLFDGRLSLETALIYGRLDLDTQRAGNVTGDTDGHRLAARFAAGYSLPLTERFSVTARAGVMAGYDKYDGFTESNGVNVDEFEIAVAVLDAGLDAHYRVHDAVTLHAGAKTIFDFSNDLLNHAVVGEFDNGGFELSTGATLTINDNMTFRLNGNYEFAQDDGLDGKGVSGTLRIRF